jgi:hypothetical protein
MIFKNFFNLQDLYCYYFGGYGAEGFELRALNLQNRFFATQVTPLVHFALTIFVDGGLNS